MTKEHECFDCGDPCDCGGQGGEDCVGCQRCEVQAAAEDARVAAVSGQVVSRGAENAVMFGVWRCDQCAVAMPPANVDDKCVCGGRFVLPCKE